MSPSMMWGVARTFYCVALLQAVVHGQESIFGFSSVFLNGIRGLTVPDDPADGVRTQETNLGDLTADANLFVAQLYDPTVVISLRHGGGIRARHWGNCCSTGWI